jgi:hypothetical protein
MPETWGLLPKSQIDNELIEEAIARLILEHNEDETAHLGTGQSLQSHKASEIIDHLARSIVFDKISGSQMIYNTQFENSAVFSVVGTPVFEFPGFTHSPASGGYASRDHVYINCEDKSLVFDFTKDMIFQFAFQCDSIATSTFRFLINALGSCNVERNFGLTISDGVAKFFFAETDGDNPVYLDWSAFAAATYYVVRFKYVAADQKVYIYINNTLLGSLTCPNPASSDYLYIHFAAWNTTVGQIVASVSNFSFQLEP